MEYNIIEVKSKPIKAPGRFCIYSWNGDKYVFCPIRNKLCKAKPEEIVRQWWIYRLKEVYGYVRESDATMCHITSEDWKEYYSEHYSEKDLDDLENEIKKYGLEEVVEVFDGEYITSDNKIIESDYRIIGYGDLETRFIDDRKLNLETSYESGFEIQ